MRLLMVSMERQDFSKRQTDLLQNVPPESIAHGATVPLAVIQQFVSEGMLVEFGSGTGEKGNFPPPYSFTGFEINTGSVAVAWEKYRVISVPGDVRSFWSNDINLASIVYLERAAGVLSQGLFANVISNTDSRYILRTADMTLCPGGCLFLAEPIRFDDPSIPDSFWDLSFAGASLEEWRARWLIRYKINAEAGLPYGVFTVAKLGPEKEKLDWSVSVDAVRKLIDSDQLERFARHIRPDGFHAYLRHLQYTKLYYEPTIMLSRCGEPLVGMIAVYQKDYGLQGKRHERVFRYLPWGFKGSTEDEMRRGIRRSKSHGSLIKDLQQTMPKTQQPPKKFVLHSHK